MNIYDCLPTLQNVIRIFISWETFLFFDFYCSIDIFTRFLVIKKRNCLLFLLDGFSANSQISFEWVIPNKIKNKYQFDVRAQPFGIELIFIEPELMVSFHYKYYYLHKINQFYGFSQSTKEYGCVIVRL